MSDIKTHIQTHISELEARLAEAQILANFSTDPLVIEKNFARVAELAQQLTVLRARPENDITAA